MALNKSIIVAALALPIPKLMIVIPFAEALGILPSKPRIGTLKCSAKISTYFEKFVSRMCFVNCSSGRLVYLGNQLSTISCFVFIINLFLFQGLRPFY